MFFPTRTRTLLAATARPACRNALAFAAALALLSPAHAGRPLATDDAGVVDHGACQFELWQERSRGERALWLNTGCNPLGSTEFTLAVARLRDGDGSATPWAWQLKQLLRAPEGHSPGFALALAGERDRRVHAGLPAPLGDTTLTGIATWPLAAETLVLHTNLGLLREREGTARRNRATWAAALDAELRPATWGSVESFGTGSERPRWQLGLRHAVSDALQIDAAFGAQAGRYSATRGASLGLVFVAPVLR